MIEFKEVKPENRDLLWNIHQKYLYEMTTYYDDEMDESGNYHYGYFDAYFTEPERKALLIYDRQVLVGFAMINPYSYIHGQPDHVLAEFTGNPELVFKANNATMLTSLIKWASTLVGSVSSPASKTAEAEDKQETENSEQNEENKKPKVQAQNYLSINNIPKPGDVEAEDVW